MYAALFELNDWSGKRRYISKGRTPLAVLKDFEEIYSLFCMYRFGRIREDGRGQAELDKLKVILDKKAKKEFTVEDLLSIDISLGIGCVKCVDVIEGKCVERRLMAKHSMT